MTKKWASLHTHNEFSTLDGMAWIEEIATSEKVSAIGFFTKPEDWGNGCPQRTIGQDWFQNCPPRFSGWANIQNGIPNPAIFFG